MQLQLYFKISITVIQLFSNKILNRVTAKGAKTTVD